ncbi:MAG: PqqD family protein [Acidobacteria bacterium]|nr:PqqD family protein [Acidobacteriota bacterium]
MVSIPNTIRKLSNADGAVVLDLRRGAMFRINQVGARVLDLLERGESAIQIADTLSAEFEIPFSQAQADVAEFVATLRARGVVDVPDACTER